MPGNMLGMNNMLASPLNIMSSQMYASDSNIDAFAHKPAPRVKVDLNPPRPKVANISKAKGETNKAGPKKT